MASSACPGSSQTSKFLTLPGEIRNLIYNAMMYDMLGSVHFQSGKMIPHAFTHVCRQTRLEYGTFFAGHLESRKTRPKLRGAIIKLKDFDFRESVEILERFSMSADTKFDIHVRITKQMYRKDWTMLWPWIRLCDEINGHDEAKQNRIFPRYHIDAEHSACNPIAASHELYIETVPYIMQGATRGGAKCCGYEQIEKIRAALSSGVYL